MKAKRKPSAVVFQGLEAGLRMFRWVVVILLVLFCFSGFKKVEPGNVGILLRFGKLQQVRQPGLLTALPYPIDEVLQVPIKQEGEIVIDEVYKKITDIATTDKINPVLEGYCLTGDQNVIQAQLVAKYRITDPVAFQLWATEADRNAILRDVVLAALTQTVAGWSFDEVLALQRGDPRSEDGTQSLPALLRTKAQQRLDELGEASGVPGCGIEIRAVDFKERHPPRHVYADFRRVWDAQNDMRTLANNAQAYYDRVVLNAETEHDRMIKQATANESQTVARANAEVTEFKDLYEQYRKNPRFHWQRIYKETIEEVLAKVKRPYFVLSETKFILGDSKDQP